MKSTRCRSPRTTCLRAGLLLVLGAAVLVGSLELHGDHRLLVSDAPAFSHPGCHPELATHLEPTAPGKHRECPACLSRLRLRGSHLAPQTLAAVESLPVCSLRESREETLAEPRGSVSTRGPPTSFA